MSLPLASARGAAWTQHCADLWGLVTTWQCVSGAPGPGEAAAEAELLEWARPRFRSAMLLKLLTSGTLLAPLSLRGCSTTEEVAQHLASSRASESVSPLPQEAVKGSQGP